MTFKVSDHVEALETGRFLGEVIAVDLPQGIAVYRLGLCTFYDPRTVQHQRTLGEKARAEAPAKASPQEITMQLTFL